MRETIETEVSLDRETHQVLVALEAPGVSIAVAFDPWVDDYVLPGALEEIAKELDHAHAVGPNRAAELDLTVDGGDDDGEEDEWNPQPAKLREGETPDVDNHARRNAEALRQLADDVDDDELAEKARDRADDLEGSR